MPHTYSCLASRLSADCLDELSERRSLFTKPQSRLRMGGGSAQQRTGSGLVWDCVCRFALRQKILSRASQSTCTPWMQLLKPSAASSEAEKEQWDEGTSREQKPKMTTYGLPMAFERLVWKASAVLHFTHKHWQLTHHRRNDHLTQQRGLCLMEKMGTSLDVIHQFVQLLSAALAYTGDVKKSKLSCKLSVAAPALVSGHGCQQEEKWERPLHGWALPLSDMDWMIPVLLSGSPSPTMDWTGAIAPISQSLKQL